MNFRIFLRMNDLRKKYARIFNEMTLGDLNRGIDFSFSEEDIMAPDGGGIRHESQLLLGYYQPRIIDEFFRRYRIPKLLSTLGISDEIKTRLDLEDPFLHKFTLYTGEFTDDSKLVEIFFRKRALPIPSFRTKDKRADCLYIDWLMMQNPYRKFMPKKPALPGQKYPGLRIGGHVLEILFNIARRIRSDGLANSPNYLHTAVLFSKEFMFIDPEIQAISEATKNYLLKRYSLWTVAWASVYGAIIHLEDDRPFAWNSSPMLLPISSMMKEYFNSRWYRSRLRDSKDRFRVRIDFDILNEKIARVSHE